MMTPWHCWPFVWVLWGGIHRSSMDSSYKGPVMRRFVVFFVVILNELPNQMSRCRWFETSWRSCDITVTNTKKDQYVTLEMVSPKVFQHGQDWQCDVVPTKHVPRERYKIFHDSMFLYNSLAFLLLVAGRARWYNGIFAWYLLQTCVEEESIQTYHIWIERPRIQSLRKVGKSVAVPPLHAVPCGIGPPVTPFTNMV